MTHNGHHRLRVQPVLEHPVRLQSRQDSSLARAEVALVAEHLTTMLFTAGTLPWAPAVRAQAPGHRTQLPLIERVVGRLITAAGLEVHGPYGGHLARVLATGMSGVGKTTLLQEMAHRGLSWLERMPSTLPGCPRMA